MKNNKLTKVVLMASVFASSAAWAESEYPATDFQPKVLYNDAEYKHSSDAPATDTNATADIKQAAKSNTVESDQNYPATNYQPKVLFSDSEYKHSATAPAAGSSSKSSPTPASAAVEVMQTEKSASSNFSYIGLIILAVAGFFIYNKKSGPKKSETSYKSVVVDYTASADGATGVEKYLEKLVDVNKTGVAKYLEKQTATPSTGVAKYMAKQIVKDREAAAAKATGVEKYLRDKG